MDSTVVVEEWFEKYSDGLYNFLIYYTRSSEVEGIVQETFIRAIRNFHSYEKKAKPKTWLYHIARNVAIDEARKKKRTQWEEEVPIMEDKIDSGERPEEVYQLQETKRTIYHSINRLKDSYRDVLLLRCMNDFSIDETAQILEWTQNQVRVTYHRALKALQKELNKHA
ncbi:RNA polymerase sigma factor [Pontibacillus sp. HMF3514]|uniref:RNA polymerase sigma factor n=1 Tax=Pontibacillus sp. HMF3514 TaxID=2692425 RepID=UPI00131F5923|nr:RNA polymerase sigma factor [Pontibacillus sp. HMF3514]QHE50783.1 sigma-70 family RNA polymerase sigma factor [Pontibacillus sp. HMF3514]